MVLIVFYDCTKIIEFSRNDYDAINSVSTELNKNRNSQITKMRKNFLFALPYRFLYGANELFTVDE